MTGPRSIARACAFLLGLALSTQLPAAPSIAAPVDYQAEDATISQGVVESNHAGYTGTGFVNGDNVVGSYVQWTVDAATAGPHNLTFRYANGTTTNRPINIAVNGTSVAPESAFPGTGAWTTWQNNTVRANLTAGTNTVRATATTTNGGPNLDRLTVDAASSTVITVRSISELQSAIGRANPGDRIELVNGSYSTSGPITVGRSGSSGSPITIAAQSVGGVEITGSAGFAFSGAGYVTVEGFRFRHGGSISVPADSHHVRLTRNVVQLTSGGNWVTIVGNDNEVDHNTFQNRSTEGVFLQISGPGDNAMAQRTWIHHNYFYNHTFSGANGGESIRLGYSYRQLGSARAIVEYNLFERTDGDSEAISVKSSDNLVRYNTLRNSRGSIVLRHGNRNRVEGNLMLGNTAGIRFYDNDHVIVNNLIQGGTGQIIAGSGTIADDTTGSTAHARPDRVLVAFNTVIGNRTDLLNVGDSNSERLGPNDCTFANNILVGGGSGALVNVGISSNLHWQGNILWNGTRGEMPSSGGQVINPQLTVDSGGLNRLTAGSPAIDGAAGTYDQVILDFDLQSRTGPKDVGADEYSISGALRRPLTTADVGLSGP